MLAEPIVITISGTGRSLKRTGTGDNTASYRDPASTSALVVRHTYGKRTRHEIRFTDTKTTADPLVTGSSFATNLGVNLVIDAGAGYTVAEAKAVVDGVLAAVNASSGALLTQILGGES